MRMRTRTLSACYDNQRSARLRSRIRQRREVEVKIASALTERLSNDWTSRLSRHRWSGLIPAGAMNGFMKTDRSINVKLDNGDVATFAARINKGKRV